MSPIHAQHMLVALSQHNVALCGSSSLDQAAEHLACIGELVGLPKLGFVDNIVHDRPLAIGRGRSLQYDVMGWCPKMLAWWYDQRVFLHHPDVRHAAGTLLPFMSQVQDANPSSLNPAELEIRTVLMDAGLASELLVPVHLPRGGVSIVGWASEEKGACEKVPEEVKLGLMATAYAFVHLVERERVGSEGRQGLLTTRQRECLALIARGSSVKEVAIALHLSPHTVQDYLRDAARRLGARSRSQLVSLALSRGELAELSTCH
jgi:DNA-binding CsgD family transcriptional regulator